MKAAFFSLSLIFFSHVKVKNVGKAVENAILTQELRARELAWQERPADAEGQCWKCDGRND